jgi:hypothetical protein
MEKVLSMLKTVSLVKESGATVNASAGLMSKINEMIILIINDPFHVYIQT